MYFTRREVVAGDLVAGIKGVERLEGARRRGEKRGKGGKELGEKGKEKEGEEEKVRVVLIAHSAGGALSQYVLSRGLVTVDGFCLFAGVPGFGSYVLPVSSFLFRLHSFQLHLHLHRYAPVLGRFLDFGRGQLTPHQLLLLQNLGPGRPNPFPLPPVPLPLVYGQHAPSPHRLLHALDTHVRRASPGALAKSLRIHALAPARLVPLRDWARCDIFYPRLGTYVFRARTRGLEIVYSGR